MNMREMIARALAEPIMREFDGWPHQTPFDWSDVSAKDRDKLHSLADAILSTLMNPTPEMLVQFERGISVPDELFEAPTGHQIALTVWQAMIRAAGEG